MVSGTSGYQRTPQVLVLSSRRSRSRRHTVRRSVDFSGRLSLARIRCVRSHRTALTSVLVAGAALLGAIGNSAAVKHGNPVPWYVGGAVVLAVALVWITWPDSG